MNGLFFRLLKVLVLGVLLLAVATATQPASAPATKKPLKAKISGFAVDVEKHNVLVTFKLAHAFDDELKRRLESGLSTSLLFDFELVRKRRMWFNKTVVRGRLQVSAMYDAVNREYHVNYKHNGDLIESRLVKEPEELYSAMSEFDRVIALPLEGKQGELVVRMRAELGTGSFLFFIPTRRTTEWVEKRILVGE